jgi:glycosyltransferase involved in cell wall biosynthesis
MERLAAMHSGPPAPGVSVLIASHDNCARLAVTLANIARCHPPPVAWELVLVANGCSDDTAAVVCERAATLPLIYCELPSPGLSQARNAGIKMARGGLIVCTDDDVRPCPDWLVAYWNAFRELGTGWFFGGPLVSEFEGGERPPLALLPFANRSIAGWYGGTARREIASNEHFMGANWAFPAAAIRHSGGFDEALGLDASLGRRRVGEEFDLMDRLRAHGLRGMYLPTAQVQHFVPKSKCTMRYLADNARASGRSSVRFRRHAYFVHEITGLQMRLGAADGSLAGLLRALWATLVCGLELGWAALAGYERGGLVVALHYAFGCLEGHLMAVKAGFRASSRVGG